MVPSSMLDSWPSHCRAKFAAPAGESMLGELQASDCSVGQMCPVRSAGQLAQSHRGRAETFFADGAQRASPARHRCPNRPPGATRAHQARDWWQREPSTAHVTYGPAKLTRDRTWIERVGSPRLGPCTAGEKKQRADVRARFLKLDSNSPKVAGLDLPKPIAVLASQPS